MNRDLPTLRVLATGLDEELSLNANSEAIAGPQFENNRQFVNNPNRYLFSQLDFVFFFNVIGSLLAFVFTYDAISGEYRRGTLRLVLINSISRPLLLTAKFVGSYLSLITSLLPALISVILLLYLMPNVNLRPSDWIATLFLFLLALLYLSVFCALGLFWIVFDKTSENDINDFDGVMGCRGLGDSQLQSIFSRLFATYTYSL